jgi:hypothetical protein
MAVRKPKLSREEIARAFAGKAGEDFPVILTPVQLAALVQRSPKTIYEWIQRGRLDGTFRKRGKHILIWRDLAIDTLMNGKDWSSADERK